MSNPSILPRLKKLLRPGVISILVLFTLLLFAAALANQVHALQNSPAVTGRVCLFLAAVLCGQLRAKESETGKLAAALLGELVLLAALLLACALCGEPIFTISMLLNLLCLAFGGFAGTLLGSRGGRRRRRRK